MPTAVKMPKLGESIVEGAVTRWLKAPGDAIDKLDPLLEVSTDKIDTEVPAPVGGTLLKIVVDAGATVEVGAVLAYIGAADESVPDGDTEQGAAAATATQSPAEQSQSGTGVAASPTEGSTPHKKPQGRAFISPVVARMAAEHNIDIARVSGSGRGGRVTKKDMLAYIEQRTADEHEPTQRPSHPAPTAETTPVAEPATGPDTLAADEILHPLTTMRRAIAQHMAQSKATSPHVTTVFEVDMTAVVRHRESLKRTLAERGVTLTFTPYFLAAVASALRDHPRVNSRFSPDGIVENRRIHLGVAVALEDGLIVPVVRDADEKNLQGLARAVNELAGRARSGRLKPDETKGGTFTITNHGVSGSLIGTPIINQPQAGILGIGAIVKRPVVRSAADSLLPSADDAIVIRPMCYLSFAFDHRVLDGAEADRFVAAVKHNLEQSRE